MKRNKKDCFEKRAFLQDGPVLRLCAGVVFLVLVITLFAAVRNEDGAAAGENAAAGESDAAGDAEAFPAAEEASGREERAGLSGEAQRAVCEKSGTKESGAAKAVLHAFPVRVCDLTAAMKHDPPFPDGPAPESALTADPSTPQVPAIESGAQTDPAEGTTSKSAEPSESSMTTQTPSESSMKTQTPSGRETAPDESPEPASPDPVLFPTPAPKPDETVEGSSAEAGRSDRETVWSVYDVKAGGVVNLTLYDCIRYMLASEMSGDAPLEALKAQAVAVRSFLYSRKDCCYACHKGAWICSDSGHCISWKTPEEYERIEEEHRARIEDAVLLTDGVIVLYGGKPAKTYFHSCSYFYTASAEEVFGNDLPYLRAVPTGVYRPVMRGFSYTRRELLTELFGKTECAKILSEDAPPYSARRESASGRVESVTICGREVTGERFREIFGFASTLFEISYESVSDVFSFTVYGSGHGVGMSQSGAKEMAQRGKSYEEILLHYYPGTTVEAVF